MPLSPTMQVSRLLLLLAVPLAGCTTPRIPVRAAGPVPSDRPIAAPAKNPARPKPGDREWNVRAFYGIPVLQRSFFWDGNGEVDTTGIKVRHLWQTSDTFALGPGLTLQNWWVGGNDVQTAEVEAVGRMVADLGEPVVFLEFTGGYSQSTDAIPPGGTEWNFTFSFGPGMRVPIGDAQALDFGVTYHHTSNALGHDNPRNPSQNEVQLWLGFGWTF